MPKYIAKCGLTVEADENRKYIDVAINGRQAPDHCRYLCWRKKRAYSYRIMNQGNEVSKNIIKRCRFYREVQDGVQD